MQAPDAAPAAPADPSAVEQATADASAATVDTSSVAAPADTPDVAPEASPEVRAGTDAHPAPAPGFTVVSPRAARRPSPAATLTRAPDLVPQPSGASPLPSPSPAPEATQAAAPPSPAPASPAPASTPAAVATPPPEPAPSPPRAPTPPAEPTDPVASLVGGALANIAKAADAQPAPAVPSPAPAAPPPASPPAPPPAPAPALDAVAASTPAPAAATPPSPTPAPAVSPAKAPSPPPSPPKSPSPASALDTGAPVPRSRPATPPSPSASVVRPPSPSPAPASPAPAGPPAGSPSRSRPATPPKFPRPMTPPEKEKKGAGFFSRMFSGGKSKADAANKAEANSPAEPSAAPPSAAPAAAPATAPATAPAVAPVVTPSAAETTPAGSAPAPAVGPSSAAAALQAAGFGSPVTTYPPAEPAAAANGSASAAGTTPEVSTAQLTPTASSVAATEPSAIPAPVPAPAPEPAPPATRAAEPASAATAAAAAAAELAPPAAPPAAPYYPAVAPATPADASSSAAPAPLDPSSSSAVPDASLATPPRPSPSSMTPQKASTIKSDIVGMLSKRTGLGLNLKSPPRALSKEDALSVRVHSSSPLVPSSVLVSPVLRMHLVDSELGSPINPSGEATTPLQTAPFDLSRRLKSAYAADWEETLDVEEELGGLLSNRAVLLFELLQPPPSFQFYDERPDVFPGGRPARIAWGFLKLLRTKDQKPNFGRLQVQLYRWEEKAPSALGALTRGPSTGATRESPSDVAAAADAPAVFVAYKSAIKTPAALRALYPAHVNVTVSASPRGDVATALLAGSRAMPKPLLLAGPAGGLSGGVKDDDDNFESRRPSRRERIERERTLGGGWRTAEARLARAPPEDHEEVSDKLGRLPYETLCYGMNPRAAAAKAQAATPIKETIVTPGGTVKPTIVKLPHARSRVDDCEIPNGDGRTQPQVPASAREASLAAFDAMGRRLAAVFKEGSMHTLKVFDCATGAILASFPGHGAAVYDVSWEPELSSDAAERLGTVDFEQRPSRVMTASADGAARIWTVGAPEGASTGDAVAQHACECYGAVWHPLVPDVVATAARDGGIRLWRVPSIGGSPPGGTTQAQIVAGVAPSQGVAATAMAFDKGGMRLFVGFADGVVRENIVEMKDEVSLRPLRECKDTLGEPVTCVRVAPNDRKVLARTFADRIAAIDMVFFAATHSFDCSGVGGAARRHRRSPAEMAKHGATSHPLLRFAVSPDARFVVAGTPDGDARLFDLDVGGVGVSLHAASAPPGFAVNDVSWSPGAHCVAVAAAGGGRPLRVVGYADGREDVTPPPRPKHAELLGKSSGREMAARLKAQRVEAGFSAEERPRPALPARLTPDAVREMLQRVRVDSARERTAALDDARRQRSSAAGSASASAAGGVVMPASASTRFAAYQAQAASAQKEKENVARGGLGFDPYAGDAKGKAPVAAGWGEGAPGRFGLGDEGF